MMRPIAGRSIALSLLIGGLLAGSAVAQEPNPFEDPPAPTAPVATPAPGAPAPTDPAKPFEPTFDDTNPFGDPAAPAGGGATDSANPFAESSSQDFNKPALPAGAESGGTVFPADGPTTAAEMEVTPAVTPAPEAVAATAAAESGGAPAASRGISSIYVFRYVPARRADGETYIQRLALPKEDGDVFDSIRKEFWMNAAASGQIDSFNGTPGADPMTWAEWTAYAEQLNLWGQYVKGFVLAGSETECDIADLKWPGDPKPEEDPNAQQGQTGGDGRDRNIFNENRSVDDQVNQFFDSPVSDTRPGKENQQVLDPAVMDNQAKLLYQCWLDDLRKIETEQVAFMKRLKTDLLQREQNRKAYDEWRQSQNLLVLDHVREWTRRYQGDVTMIGNVRYELYRPGAVPATVPRGANVVVTDADLTPYDLLNGDGSLRGPAKE